MQVTIQIFLILKTTSIINIFSLISGCTEVDDFEQCKGAVEGFDATANVSA